jgi:hypothetical protein
MLRVISVCQQRSTSGLDWQWCPITIRNHFDVLHVLHWCAETDASVGRKAGDPDVAHMLLQLLQAILLHLRYRLAR